ncbi:hypothetical protein N657DRAFT_257273 [Parathielavia appendiculata]|uniref:BTB domain-containing protein n=1 Tax=Parathielavia appendiculata TaxID=2587402 RepID=A0AAN6YYY0_9PEZI|nr:hypothetical protein N657DRAFT_257273 [Parathielavia appendiculata]
MEPAQNNPSVYLSDQADLVLVVRNTDGSKVRSFLVFSSMLRHASPYFETLLSPRFEGRQLREAQKEGSQLAIPGITLEEDDVEAMDFIFSCVHFRAERIPRKLTAESIANIAIQSDKYDFNGALIGWINCWCDANNFPQENGTTARDMGYGLLAAYLFRSPAFSTMSARYAHDLPPDFRQIWREYKILSRLPEALKGIYYGCPCFLGAATKNSPH